MRTIITPTVEIPRDKKTIRPPHRLIFSDAAKPLTSEQVLKVGDLCYHLQEEEGVDVNKLNLDPCSVCLEEMTSDQLICKLECGHFYHKDCILAWLNKTQKNNCPICRKNVEV